MSTKLTVTEKIYSLPPAFSINDQVLFETLKLQIRGKTISYASWKKKEKNMTENFLEKEINFLQQSLNVSPCEGNSYKVKS